MQGIATETIHVGQPVAKVGSGYYCRADDAGPVAGYAAHCADLGEPVSVSTEQQ
ncbi:MAG: hypothetical protein JWR37_1036 [Mycobacterium sp.]|nr:hypothetical protein [Mycobacterium sp.]